MALIHLTTTSEKSSWNPHSLDSFNRVMRAAQYSRSDFHEITDSPSEADIILFIDFRRYYHSDTINSDIYKKYYNKCLVVDFQDVTIPNIPGIYLTIPSYLHQYPIYEYGFYLCVFDDWVLTERAEFSSSKYLFSFIGNSNTYPKLRREVLNLNHPHSYLRDASNEYIDYRIYADVLNLSKFVLCPRGIGVSSYRVFETMRQARVPVIISDDWIPPVGTNWNEFSVIIPEGDVNSIPARLEEIEIRAEEMGHKALEYWQANFALETSFDCLVEAALRIQSLRSNYQHIIDRNIWFESFKREHFSKFLKEFIRNKLGKI